MILSYKYRAYANQETLGHASEWLELCRRVYNWGLEQRILAYVEYGCTLTCYDQDYALTSYKRFNPEYLTVDAQCLQEVMNRLSQAYKAFFRRVKKGSTPGFPRFKGRGRYDSFTLKQNGWQLDGKYLRIRNVGTFKLRLSRPIQGAIKTVTVRRTSTDKWYVTFACDSVPRRRLEPSDKSVGIDVGIKAFAVDSNGLTIDNPKYLRESQQALRRKQRKLCRRIKGSKRRAKARLQVAKAHEKVANQRNDFLHKLANYYVKNYGTIAVEDLNIVGMVKNHCLARSIQDASWSQFFNLLSYKAEEAGRVLVKVKPNGTSQICSGCGEKVPKTLAERTHSCPTCGLVLDRDENAARNINRLGQSLQAQTEEVALCVA